MSTPSHDDLGPGAVTQGGAPDSEGPGPNRVRGRSIWWIGAVVVIGAVVGAFALSGRAPHAPAEVRTAPLAGSASGQGAPAAPASRP